MGKEGGTTIEDAAGQMSVTVEELGKMLEVGESGYITLCLISDMFNLIFL